MKKIKLTFLAVASIFIISNATAQTQNRIGNWCATTQNAEQLKQNNPALIQQESSFRNQIKDYINNNPQTGAVSKTSPYIIPVVFHCITDNGAGYCSKASIDDQLLTLNEDFQRMNSDASNTRAQFLPYAMSMNIEFRLAHKDPNGNCTEGIVRTDSPLSTSCVPRDAVKAVSYWDSRKYFNIWVVNSIDPNGSPGIILGYAQIPWSGINTTYGIVIGNNYVSRTDRTLTHEMGHCFGLLHTFEGACGSSCQNSGDWVCDTPPSITATYGCATSQNTCANDATGSSVYSSNVVDKIENYMSYDACQNMFTLGQKTTMEFTLNSLSVSTGLDQLNTPANLAAAGVDNPYNPAICVPIADFSYDKEFICAGSSVTFTDDSYNATPTGWNWSFTGGTPSTSPSPNPTITYNTPGVYSVTNNPSTSAGTGSITKNSIITVSSLTAAYAGPVVDGFENTTQFSNDWWINNVGGGGFTWENNNAAAATGSRSVRIRNTFTGTDGLVDELVSPSFDLSTSAVKTMTFKVAYAKKNSASSDKMFVYTSIDCGATWSLKLPLVANTMTTAPDNTGSFIPSASQWAQKSIDLTSIGTSTNVRFKFKFTSGGGNDIYLDDINIGGSTVGIDDFNSIASFSVYPNPTNSSAQISFNLVTDVKNLSIKVRNAVGQEVTKVINGQSFTQGKYTLKIDEERKLSAGIYFVEFNADNNVQIQKLIVQ